MVLYIISTQTDRLTITNESPVLWAASAYINDTCVSVQSISKYIIKSYGDSDNINAKGFMWISIRFCIHGDTSFPIQGPIVIKCFVENTV